MFLLMQVTVHKGPVTSHTKAGCDVFAFTTPLL